MPNLRGVSPVGRDVGDSCTQHGRTTREIRTVGGKVVAGESAVVGGATGGRGSNCRRSNQNREREDEENNRSMGVRGRGADGGRR